MQVSEIIHNEHSESRKNKNPPKVLEHRQTNSQHQGHIQAPEATAVLNLALEVPIPKVKRLPSPHH